MKHRWGKGLENLSVWIGSLIFLVWFICMGCLTAFAAQSILEYEREQCKLDHEEYEFALSHIDSTKAALPGYEEYCLWELASRGGWHSGFYWNNRGLLSFVNMNVTAWGSTVIFDGNGRPLAFTACHMRFPYYYEEWAAGAEERLPDGYAVALFEEQFGYEEAVRRLEDIRNAVSQSAKLRIKGAADGAYIRIKSVEYWAESGGGAEGKWAFVWPDVLYEEGPDGSKEVTLYVDCRSMTAIQAFSTPKQCPPFFYRGKRQDSLTGFLKEEGRELLLHTSEGECPDQENVKEGVFLKSISPDSQGFGMEPEILTGYVIFPLVSAVKALWKVYFLTFLAVICGFFILCRRIYNNIAKPIRAVNRGLGGDWRFIRQPGEKESCFRDVAELIERYEEAGKQAARAEDEKIRLTREAEYDGKAEQNRRKMMSAIAHDLKTPLAVIHSYAEGLKEHIAEDKRDRYTQVLLEETERMNGMVMEMLDLSRMEAGRIFLEREDVSMKKLMETVWERLKLEAGKKSLHIHMEGEGEFIVYGDKKRLEQAVTNLAANALAYTPPDGSVWVRLQNQGKKVVLSMENECGPLSEESLSRVWDSFYRGEESRSGEGNGLGLAIVKNIVELHGGTCFAEKTKRGVKFGMIMG